MSPRKNTVNKPNWKDDKVKIVGVGAGVVGAIVGIFGLAITYDSDQDASPETRTTSSTDIVPPNPPTIVLETTTSTSAQLPPETPEPPTIFRDGDGTLTLVWEASDNAESYNIFRDISDQKLQKNPNIAPEATGITGTRWEDPRQFPNDNPHTYRIQAVNASGTSEVSKVSRALSATGPASSGN